MTQKLFSHSLRQLKSKSKKKKAVQPDEIDGNCHNFLTIKQTLQILFANSAFKNINDILSYFCSNRVSGLPGNPVIHQAQPPYCWGWSCSTNMASLKHLM